MPASRASLWEDHERCAVVGHSARRAFPKLTYRGLKRLGKTVHAVDPAGGPIDDDRSYRDLALLPAPIDAAVLKLPKEETAEWDRPRGARPPTEIRCVLSGPRQPAACDTRRLMLTGPPTRRELRRDEEWRQHWRV